MPQLNLRFGVVKTPLTFFQKQRETLFGNPIEFPHVTLRLILKFLNAVDVVPLVRKELGMVDPEVFEVRDIQHIVGPPTVGINDDWVGGDSITLFPVMNDPPRIRPATAEDAATTGNYRRR